MRGMRGTTAMTFSERADALVRDINGDRFNRLMPGSPNRVLVTLSASGNALVIADMSTGDRITVTAADLMRMIISGQEEGKGEKDDGNGIRRVDSPE